MPSPHKISKLIFEVSMPGDENQARTLQSEIEQIISKHISEALDRPLSKFNDEQVELIIEKLEIDIGSFDLKNDQEKLFKTIAEKVEQEIHKVSKTAGIPDGLSSASETKNMTELDLVFYILRNGHLPWWADFGKKVDVIAFFRQFLRKPSAKQLSQFKRQLVNPVFRKRLVHYLPEKELLECVGVLIPRFISDGKSIIESSKVSSLFKEQFFELLFDLSGQNNPGPMEEIIEAVIELLEDHKISPKLLNLESLPVGKDMRYRLVLLTQLAAEKTKKRKLNGSDQKTGQKKKQAEIWKSVHSKNTGEEETENSIAVSNAGLVLILPFLARFFENIGIAKNKEFTSEDEQHYAVYLLHYIATGSTDPVQEHELFFEKLICGIEAGEVLKPGSEFKQSHLEEVEELLKSVIENWKALKNSSPQTLQTAFLQRTGYLIRKDDGAWSLHIERQTIDILLNKLPWTISINKLPFDSMMIYTEW